MPTISLRNIEGSPANLEYVIFVFSQNLVLPNLNNKDHCSVDGILIQFLFKLM